MAGPAAIAMAGAGFIAMGAMAMALSMAPTAPMAGPGAGAETSQRCDEMMLAPELSRTCRRSTQHMACPAMQGLLFDRDREDDMAVRDHSPLRFHSLSVAVSLRFISTVSNLQLKVVAIRDQLCKLQVLQHTLPPRAPPPHLTPPLLGSTAHSALGNSSDNYFLFTSAMNRQARTVSHVYFISSPPTQPRAR